MNFIVKKISGLIHFAYGSNLDIHRQLDVSV